MNWLVNSFGFNIIENCGGVWKENFKKRVVNINNVYEIEYGILNIWINIFNDYI